MQNKGIIYSMDTAFAIYIVLLAIASFSIMYNYSNTFDRADLTLSRLARDAYNIQLTNPNVEFPEGISTNFDICKKETMTGHAFVLGTDEEGMPAINDFVACYSERTEEDEAPPALGD